MQGQAKGLIIASVVSLLIFVGYYQLFPAPKPTPKPVDVSATNQVVAASGAVTLPNASVVEAPPVDRAPAQLLRLSFPEFSVVFTSRGGAITSWKLTDARYAKDATAGELIPQQVGATALQTQFVNSTYAIPAYAEWSGTKVSDTVVRYTFENAQVKIVKTFTVVPAGFLVKLRTEASVKQAATLQLALRVFGFQDPKQGGGGGQSVKARVWTSDTWRGEELVQTSAKDVAESGRGEQGFRWTGFGHPYFLVALSGADKALEKHTSLGFVEGAKTATEGLMQTDLWLPPAAVSASQPMVKDVVLYVGPMYYSVLADADAHAGFATGFKDSVDLGWFGFIGRPLLWLLKQFERFVGSWGLAIILLTVFVKAVTLHWTTSSMRSMKEMAALAPQMKELQEKYKDDRQRLGQEQMALYKAHKVNPVAGCLPMLLQMPIWLALYRMLASAGELYLQPFLWVPDLTNTDPKYIIPSILVLAMFAQTRMTPTASVDPQQKFIMMAMPVVFGVMSYWFPAGLGVYMLTNTLLSLAHSLYMKRYDKPAAVATVAAGGAVEVAAPVQETNAMRGGKKKKS